MENLATEISTYFEKIKSFNQEGNTHKMADVAWDLERYLIQCGVITDDLLPTDLSQENEITNEIANIFLKVRRIHQDDNEELTDFSYLLVADNWLLAHNIDPSID
jgi:hypothetical protein